MQRKYVTDLLTKTNMLHSKPVSTPMASSPKLTLNSDSPLSDPREYRQVVGSLQYLSLTRPDISYAVNKLSQFMHSPTTCHWLAVKRLLRYLSGHSVMKSISANKVKRRYMHSRMPIGQETQMTLSLPTLILSTLETILSLGHQRSIKE